MQRDTRWQLWLEKAEKTNENGRRGAVRGDALKTGNAKAVDQAIQLDACLAQRAFGGNAALIIFQILFFIVDADDGETSAVVNAGENGADTLGRSAVIADGLNGSLHSITRNGRSGQHQHMFAGDHGRGIIAEKQLAAGGMLGRNHINSAVRVHVGVAGLRQLAGHAGANQLGAVQAQNGIDDGGILKAAAQFGCGGAGLGQAVLGHRQVQIIIDMAVAGGKMTVRQTQRQTGLVTGKGEQLNGHGRKPASLSN